MKAQEKREKKQERERGIKRGREAKAEERV